MVIFKMGEDKSFIRTVRAIVFEGENKADIMRFILPKTINDIDIKECTVNLHIVNAANLADVINISPILTEYNDSLYLCEIDLSNNYTYQNGELSLWIEVLDTETDMVAKSGVAKLTVRDHPSPEGSIPEQQLTLLVQWQKDVNDIYSNMQILHTATEENAQEASDAAKSAKQNADEINILYAKIVEITPDSEALKRHMDDTSNPHKVTAKDVGLDNVDNTRDVDKPISTATQKALDDIGTQVGDISTALDSINALQESYIGGGQ